MIFRTSIHHENNVKTRLVTKNNKTIISTNGNILGKNENLMLKINNNNDDSEIIKGNITLKENGLFKVHYEIKYLIAGQSKSKETEGVYLCL